MSTGKIIEVKSPDEKKKWTVGCVYQILVEKTVIAPTQELALSAVRGGFGAHAGEYGPFLQEMMIKETGTKDEVFDAKRFKGEVVESQASPKSLILTPPGL